MIKSLSLTFLLALQVYASLAGQSPSLDGARLGIHSDTTRTLVLPPVMVTAGLTQLKPALAPFSIAVIEASDIKALPIRAVSDALAYNSIRFSLGKDTTEAEVLEVVATVKGALIKIA